MIELLEKRARGATICASEAADAIDPADSSALYEPARSAARRLAAAGDVEIVQAGRVVDGSTSKGALRVRLTNRG